jgi:hypothetical protein
METALIVAMSMQGPQVGENTATTRSAGDDVVDLDAVPIGEEQSTVTAASLLPLEQECHARLDQRMGAETLRPVHQVSVVRAGRPFDLQMEPDAHTVVPSKHLSIRADKRPGGASSGRPVLPLEPRVALAGVAEARPVPEQFEEVVIAPAEHPGGPHRPVIPSPSGDDRGQGGDQVSLACCPMGMDDQAQVRLMPDDRLCAGTDVELEGAGTATSVLADFGPSGRVLPNREAKEVKAHPILYRMQGVSEPRLALL